MTDCKCSTRKSNALNERVLVYPWCAWKHATAIVTQQMLWVSVKNGPFWFFAVRAQRSDYFCPRVCVRGLSKWSLLYSLYLPILPVPRREILRTAPLSSRLTTNTLRRYFRVDSIFDIILQIETSSIIEIQRSERIR